MIQLAGAAIVLPDRVVPRGSVLIDGDRIVSVEDRLVDTPAGASRVDLHGALVVPGFIDVHVHGVEGRDALDGGGAIADIAARLPRYGVTAFCPTSVACDPQALAGMLDEVERLAAAPAADAARVLPAHLESNFINPEYRGAQPLACLRSARLHPESRADGGFCAREILEVVDRHRASVGIVTLAPEIDGGLDLARRLAASGHVVSLGHSGATYEEALAAFDAGVTQATHLFNRMTPMTHRAPGAPAAVLGDERVRAELICDGFHVHPAMMALALRAKGAQGILAITDGTAGSGLPVGSRARLGGRPIRVTERTAELEDGTLAGSVLTMDAVFRSVLRDAGAGLVEAARMCATTPAEQLGLSGGRIAPGAVADLAVLDEAYHVRHTFLRGRPWRNTGPNPLV